MASGKFEGLQPTMKWWGWGDRGKRFQLEGHPDLEELLRAP